jgi:hypothetical protein
MRALADAAGITVSTNLVRVGLGFRTSNRLKLELCRSASAAKIDALLKVCLAQLRSFHGKVYQRPIDAFRSVESNA